MTKKIEILNGRKATVVFGWKSRLNPFRGRAAFKAALLETHSLIGPLCYLGPKPPDERRANPARKLIRKSLFAATSLRFSQLSPGPFSTPRVLSPPFRSRPFAAALQGLVLVAQSHETTRDEILGYGPAAGRGLQTSIPVRGR